MSHPTLNHTHPQLSLHNQNLSNRKYTTPPSTPKLHIHLPLRKPKQHHHQKPPSPPPCRAPIRTQLIKPINNNDAQATSSDILRLMDGLSLPVPLDVYASLIREVTLSCDSSGALQLLDHLRRSRLKLNLPLINRVLLMSVSCGHLGVARRMFDEMSVKRDFNSWVIMIVGYLRISRFEEGMRLFVEMVYKGGFLLEFPDWVFVCVVKACGCAMDMGLGKQVHGLMFKLGKTTSGLSLSGSLMEFYGKMGCPEGSDFVFDQLSHRNVVIWMVKIANHCREGRFVEALRGYRDMGREGIRWNKFTFSSSLRACARVEDGGNCGRQVHVNAIKFGLESDAFVQCGLIDMYGKRGIVRDAERVFEMIPDKKNAACWNAMLNGYVQNGFYVEALKFLYRMKAAGIEVSESRIDGVRIACGTNALEKKTKQLCAWDGLA